MNVLKPMPEMPDADDRDVVPVGRITALPLKIAPGARRKTFRMFLVAALLSVAGWRSACGGIPPPTPRSMRRPNSVAA